MSFQHKTIEKERGENELRTRENKTRGKMKSLMEILQWYQEENILVVRYMKVMTINQSTLTNRTLILFCDQIKVIGRIPYQL